MPQSPVSATKSLSYQYLAKACARMEPGSHDATSQPKHLVVTLLGNTAVPPN